jgi:hypothetical protein
MNGSIKAMFFVFSKPMAATTMEKSSQNLDDDHFD